MKTKKAKIHKENHVSPHKKGMGDHYGPAIKQPMGRIRDQYYDENKSSSKFGRKPKALA